MTAKEFLEQGLFLDQKIKSEMDEMDRLRALAESISSPKLGTRVKTSTPGEAPFVRSLEKIDAMEHRIDMDLNRLLALREQLWEVIQSVPDVYEQMILSARYLEGRSWGEICQEMNMGRTTAYLLHERGVSHVVVPEDLIQE